MSKKNAQPKLTAWQWDIQSERIKGEMLLIVPATQVLVILVSFAIATIPAVGPTALFAGVLATIAIGSFALLGDSWIIEKMIGPRPTAR